MQRNRAIWIAAGLVALLAIALLLWALLPQSGNRPGSRLLTAVNPTLNLRYLYDASVFSPAPFDPNAEFALQLNARAASGPGPQFALFGKRIAGIGRLLGKAPSPQLYDFVGSQYAAEFEESSKLLPLGEPHYEDLELHGSLGLRQVLRYGRPAGQRWPTWFPAGLAKAEEATLEGWVFFHGSDLYFFYAVSAEPLDDATRDACSRVVESLDFDLVGGDKTAASAAPGDGAAAANGPSDEDPAGGD